MNRVRRREPAVFGLSLCTNLRFVPRVADPWASTLRNNAAKTTAVSVGWVEGSPCFLSER